MTDPAGGHPSLDPPTASEEFTKALQPPSSKKKAQSNPGSCLEESLVVLHQSMEEARNVDISECLEDEKRDDKNEKASDTTWLMNMFSRLERQHKTEKKDWEKNLRSEKTKKVSYKKQLKSAYTERLRWLEDQLENTETAQCCSEMTDRALNIPPIRRVNTGTTQGSSSSSEDEDHDSHVRRRVASPKREQEGYEVTFHNASSMKRLQQLERTLEKTVKSHEREREQWVKTLEDAAIVTETGERLSAQQEQTFMELRTQLSTEQRSQRKKWKEQTQVLKEILELTEQQLHNERKGFEGDMKVLQNDFEKVQAEKAALESDASQANEELVKAKSKLKELSSAQDEWQLEKDAFETSMAKLTADKTDLGKQVLKLQEQLNKAVGSTTGNTPDMNSLAVSKIRSEWEGKLDRAVVERDLAQQEVRQIRSRLEEERLKWKLKLEEARKTERDEAYAQMEKARRQWRQQLDESEKERKEVTATLNSERQQWNKKLQEKVTEWENEARQKIQELQEMHSSELRQLKTSDFDLVQQYADAVESRNEMVFRLRRIEQKRNEEKCNWKLQLEAALADARRSGQQVQELRTEQETMRQTHAEEIEALRKRIAEERVEFSKQFSELHVSKSFSTSEASREMLEKVEAAHERAECQIAVLKESHAKQMKKLKSSLESMHYENVKLEAEVKKVKETNSKLRGETKEQKLILEREATKRDVMNQRHSNEVKAWASQLQESKTEVGLLTDRLGDMEHRLKETEADAKHQEATGQREWAAKFEESQAKVRTLTDKTNDLEKRLQNTSQARERVGKEALELASHLDDARAEIKTLNSQLNVSKAEVRVLSDQLKEARDEANTSADQTKESKAKLGLLQDTVTALEQRVQEGEAQKENHAKETAELKAEADLLKDKMHAMKQRLRATEEEEFKRSREVMEWAALVEESKEDFHIMKVKMNNLEMRLQDEEDAKLAHEGDAHELSSKLKGKRAEIRVLNEQILDLKQNLREASKLEKEQREEIEKWKNQVVSSQAETIELADRTEELVSRLSNLQNHHNQCKKRWEAQVERLKIQRGQSVLDQASFDQDRDELMDGSATSESFSKQQAENISQAVEELRKDVVEIRDTMESSTRADKVIEEANFGALRGDLDNIRASVDDVVAELTLETEAMYETRNAVKKLTDKTPGTDGAGDSTRFIEIQQKLFSEVEVIREGVKKLLEGQNSGTTQMQNPTSVQLVAELHKKEIVLAKCNAELDVLRDQLIAEVSKREQAEAEVVLLNDQADAYTEELMHLQAENARLEVTLTEAECKMTEALIGRERPEDPEQEIISCESNGTSESDDSSPLLEEALALAQGLTDIVQGREESGKEQSVLDILQTLSEMMDEHEKDEDDPTRAPTPQVRNGGQTTTRNQEVSTESNPASLTGTRTTPKSENSSISESNEPAALNVMVEQLYARCQLLERERLEMMETTLNLLESARKSSPRDVDTALETARKKTAEDLIRVRKQNHKDRERLYHKVCSRAAMIESPKSATLHGRG